MFLSIILSGSQDAWGSQQAFLLYEQGISLERSLKIFEALDSFKKAIALDPGNTGYQEHVAWLLHNHEFREEAVQSFQQLLQQVSDKRPVYLGLGLNEKDLGRAPRAIEYYEKVYELTAPRNDFEKVFTEIQTRSRRENAEKISELKRTLANDPGNTAVEKELCQTYIYQADWENAFSIGERLLASSPTDLQFRYAYYKGLLWGGRPAEAEALLSSLIADSPDNAYLYFVLGRLQHSRNRLPEAETALEKSLALYPGAMKPRKELCEVLARKGSTEAALSLASSLNRDNEGRLEARLASARVFHFSGRLEEATPLYKQILTDYPYNEAALWGLAETTFASGNLPDAKKAVITWEMLNSDNPGLTQMREKIDKAAASVSIASDYFANSYHFRRYNAGISAKYHLGAEITPRFGYYYSLFLQRNFSNVNRHSFFIEGTQSINSSFSVDARLDMNAYDNSQNHLNGKITLQANLFAGSYFALSYSRMDIIDTEPAFGNPLYNYVASIGAVGRGITTDDFSLYLQQKIGNDLTLWGKLTSGSYSDNNDKFSYVLGADYRLTEKPFLHIHYSFFFLDYRLPAPTYREGGSQIAAYFDPNNFEVHTFGFEFKKSLSPALSLYLEDSVSYVPESKGVSNSLSGAATYRLTKVDSLRLDLRYVSSVHIFEDSGDYGAEHIMLSFNHIF